MQRKNNLVEELQKAIDSITSNDFCCCEMDTVGSDIGNALEQAVKALETVQKIPKVIKNLQNMKAAWEDESFKDRRYAEAHIKSLRAAIEQVEQLLS